ncbi:MAG: hypothetical protein PUB03_00125 [bacterium]|nr:hypothetical protein [bacterium]
MKENTQDKSLVQINENSIFYKIKNFFRSLFGKKNSNVESTKVIEKTTINNQKSNKSSFIEEIKNVENEETKLLKLQKQYRCGKIKEEELTEEQVKSLCALYDKQINNLKKSNEIRKQKLLEYRRNLKRDN